MRNALINDKSLSDSTISVFVKSGMSEAPSDYSGRPYGGVAILAKDRPGMHINEIETNSDRLLAVSLNDAHGNPVRIVACCYFPYYDKSDKHHTDAFQETIDALQGLIDGYSALCPVILCGDFNVQLPSKAKLQNQWYKEKGYNIHSRIFYDFLMLNNMILADFMFKQDLFHIMSFMVQSITSYSNRSA